MLTLLSSLRPVNLLLVILSQLTFYFLVITPSLENDLRLNNGGLLYLFVICTVLITASGYLVNDYFDFENDDINNKNKGYNEKHSLLILYYSLSLAGFFIALYIAYSIGNPLLSLIYAAATLLLYLYSSHLKSTVLLGNILVSFFTTMVFMILIVAEWPALEIQKLNNLNAYNNLIGLFVFFGLFAFCISMVREIVKDIEDSHGDILSGVHTLPVAWGVEKAKIVAAFFGFALLFVLGGWIYSTKSFHGNIWLTMVFIMTLIIPNIYLIYKCLSTRETLGFRSVSQLSKIIMFLGLFFLILYSWN